MIKISICIPHFNRSSHLIKVLNSIAIQTYKNIEVIISDDCSSDNSQKVINDYVDDYNSNDGRIRYRYNRNHKNIGYDANLRLSMKYATGDYLFILGNDDCLSCQDSIDSLICHINEYDCPDIIISNYYLSESKEEIYYRTKKDGVIGTGYELASRVFRNFSFVGGIIIKGINFNKYDSNQYDNSIYYQIYLASKIISSGGILSGISTPLIIKDVVVDGDKANTYFDKLRKQHVTLKKETGGLDKVYYVTYEGIIESVDESQKDKIVKNIFSQIYLYTYPYWLVTYKNNGFYLSTINLILGCRPSNIIHHRLSLQNKIRSVVYYISASIVGLLIPSFLFNYLKKFLINLSRRKKFL